MSLPSPLSVGDIILLGKAAYRVARALSSGSRSAPAEFSEVQALLFSLTESFDLLAKTSATQNEEDRGSADVPQDSPRKELWLEKQPELANILINCRDVLGHLETFVDKYTMIDPTVTNEGTGTRSLRGDLKRNWKKVMWTKEAEEISKLKQTLIAHTNSLHLAIAIMNGDRQASTQGQVGKIHGKLDEIYEWFLANLKKDAGESSTSASTPKKAGEPAGPTARFSLYHQKVPGNLARDMDLICPQATFNPVLLGEKLPSDLPSLTPLFCCHCTKSRLSGNVEDHAARLRFYLLPTSLVIRLTDQSSNNNWHLYVGSALSSSPVSIVVTPLHPAYISEIERAAAQIGTFQATRNSTTDELPGFLVQNSPHEISILASRAHVHHLSAKLLTICLTARGVCLAVEHIEALQVLQYASTSLPSAGGVSSEAEPLDAILFDQGPSDRFVSQQSYQILFACRRKSFGAQIERYSIHVTHDCTVSDGRGPRFVTIGTATCVHNKGTGTDTKSIKCDEVEFEFSDSSAAREYYLIIVEAKKALLVQYLQGVRHGDCLVYEREMGDIVMGHLVLADAQLRVVRDLSSNKYRLIVVRRDRVGSVCFGLTDEFLDRLANDMEPQTKIPIAQFVSVGEDGVSIVSRPIEVGRILLGGDVNLALRLK
ncbi:hypothetical protein B0T24DRAFT_389717 [Lasiosphaeria ovina]|uniref:Uncharacterized protein n=1 Tax=Lasiosphaeria ovina TaxID=92902 RepID=A0AAE0K0H8_9PEZI|nr:hypothetical protein B0T24DRAFT_389717 [Lasiosphaeria ovina]